MYATFSMTFDEPAQHYPWNTARCVMLQQTQRTRKLLVAIAYHIRGPVSSPWLWWPYVCNNCSNRDSYPFCNQDWSALHIWRPLTLLWQVACRYSYLWNWHDGYLVNDTVQITRNSRVSAYRLQPFTCLCSHSKSRDAFQQNAPQRLCIKECTIYQ